VSLRSQLLVVSLLLLSLPWAGCQYLREMESTLRTGQGMAVEATAKAIAAALEAQSNLLYPAQGRRNATQQQAIWALEAAPEALFVDGFADDWRDQPELKPVDGTPEFLTLRAATWGQRVFILLEAKDPQVRYSTPYRLGDHLELLCISDLGARLPLILAAEAPGVVPLRGDSEILTVGAHRPRGAWREGGRGYTLELQIPIGTQCERLALRLMDRGDDKETLRFDSTSLSGGTIPWLVYRVAALDTWLKAFGQPGRQITVTDNSGTLVGLNEEPAARESTQLFWLLRVLYRSVLRDHDSPSTPGSSAPAAENESANTLDYGQRWQRREGKQQDDATIRATAVIGGSAATIGTVSVSETTERYLALTDQATTRVLTVSALVLSIALLGLLFYASILSWRIRRLSNAAREIALEQRKADAFPRSQVTDELGDLSRSYADLLQQIGDYNAYLKGLARTLSHELRTPIAIVSSSLEQLSQPHQLSRDQQAYLDRSREGLSRLTRIVTAMSEASRIEETAENAVLESVDLARLLSDLKAAYGDTFSQHRFYFSPPETNSTVRGNGDLLAQAIDKLVDNAVSFTVPGQPIILRLREEDSHLAIEVENPGPPLPETLGGRLFEPMISLREEAEKQDAHLGLGLAIARTIAEAHHGSLSARNNAESGTVVFTLRLSKTPELSA